MPKKVNKKIVFAISIIRILSAISIIFNPLVGFILFLGIDYIDAYILQYFAHMGLKTYQKWDKNIDLAGYVVMIFFGYLSGSLSIFLALFVYRLIGQLLFDLIGKQKLLIFFPNFIEPFFLWKIIFRGLIGYGWLIVFFVIQILLEYFLHVFWPSYLRKNGFPGIFRFFGLKKVDNWN